MNHLIRTIIVTLAAAPLLLMPTASHATKVLPGYATADVCLNVPGVQTVYDVTGVRPPYLLNFATETPRDCVRNDGSRAGLNGEVDRTPPCASDDGPGRCVWDARHMGNGHGKSYILRADESIRYITHRRAHRLMTTLA